MQTFVEIGSAVRKIFPDKKKSDRKHKSSRTANAGRSTNNPIYKAPKALPYEASRVQNTLSHIQD